MPSKPKQGLDYDVADDDDDDANSEDIFEKSSGTNQPAAPHIVVQQKYKKMTRELCEFLNDFGLLSFIAMNIEDADVRNKYIYILLYIIIIFST
jgi:hypothetical protein